MRRRSPPMQPGRVRFSALEILAEWMMENGFDIRRDAKTFEDLLKCLSKQIQELRDMIKLHEGGGP